MPTSTPSLDDFYNQVNHLRPALLRAARNRLRNPDWAEDAVSEVILAAIQNRPDFEDPMRLRAWLFGILRHKVVDQLRAQLGHEVVVTPGEDDADDTIDWEDPHPFSDPMHRLAGQQFIRALNRQLAELPTNQARAFLMRDCWGEDSTQICDELKISAGNLCVVLHRARHRLRQALTEHQG